MKVTKIAFVLSKIHWKSADSFFMHRIKSLEILKDEQKPNEKNSYGSLKEIDSYTIALYGHT